MTDEQGEPLFVGKDVCDALGYTNSRLTISRHLDEDDVSKRYVIDEVGRRLDEDGVDSIEVIDNLGRNQRRMP